MIKYSRLLLESIIARRKTIAAVALIAFVVFLFYLRNNDYLNIENIIGFLSLHPVLAPLFFVVSYTLMIVFLVPTLPMNLGAGLLWGGFWGGILTILGASFGGLFAFIISRYISSIYVEKYFKSRGWVWIRNEINKNNWKFLFFIRANPFFPFAIFSYFFGVTPVTLKRYLVATAVAITPGVFLFAFIGSLLREISLGDGVLKIIDLLFGIIAAGTIIFIVGYGIKKYPEISKIDKTS